MSTDPRTSGHNATANLLKGVGVPLVDPTAHEGSISWEREAPYSREIGEVGTDDMVGGSRAGSTGLRASPSDPGGYGAPRSQELTSLGMVGLSGRGINFC
jgi:hypothetical protein